MVRPEILEGVPLLPPMRFNCSSVSLGFPCGIVVLERGQCGFRIRPGGASEANILQTAPAIERHKSFISQSETSPLLDGHRQLSHSSSSRPEAVAPQLKAVITAPVIKAVLNYSLLSLCEISILAILPIYLASSPLSLTPREIGIFMVGTGISSATSQILCTNAAVKQWGAKRMYQVSICAYFPLWMLLPIAVSMASADYPLWCLHLLACIGVILMATADMAFSKHPNWLSPYPIAYSVFIAIIFLFVRSAAPTPAALGTTNGLAQTMASIMRTIGPSCATCLYAVSKEYKLLGGQLVYIVFALVTAVAMSASFLLPMTP